MDWRCTSQWGDAQRWSTWATHVWGGEMPTHKGSRPFRDQTARERPAPSRRGSWSAFSTKLSYFILSLEQGGRTGEVNLAVTLTIISGAEEGRALGLGRMAGWPFLSHPLQLKAFPMVLLEQEGEGIRLCTWHWGFVIEAGLFLGLPQELISTLQLHGGIRQDLAGGAKSNAFRAWVDKIKLNQLYSKSAESNKGCVWTENEWPTYKHSNVKQFKNIKGKQNGARGWIWPSSTLQTLIR